MICEAGIRQGILTTPIDSVVATSRVRRGPLMPIENNIINNKVAKKTKCSNVSSERSCV
jgi:hypothetical protein